MPTPTVADLHLNLPLTNVSVAYKQSSSAYIADKVFPGVPVMKQSDLYRKFPKSEWRRSDVKRRAPGTESAGTGWTFDMDQYFTHVYAVHKDIDDQSRANADSYWNLDKVSTEFLTNQILLQRDIDWADAYFKTGVWATDRVGTTNFVKWSDAGSDPISDVADLRVEFQRLTGFKPNICVMGANVMKRLKQHPDFIDRIKYTQKGVVTEDLVASLFEIDECYVSYATKATGPQIPDAKAQDAAATLSFINNTDDVLFAYAPASPSIEVPSAGYTFNWKGYIGGNAQGLKVSRFRMDHIKSDRIEVEATYDMKVVAADCGYFLSDAVD